MAEPLGEAFVRIRANTAGFRGQVEREARSTFRSVAQIAAGVTGGLFAVEAFREAGRAIREVVQAASEEQVRAELLDKTITNVGASHRAFGKDIETLIDQESRLSGFTDQELSSAFTRLVSATKDTGKAFKDLQLAEDTSRVRKVQLGQAAIALSKAEQGSTTALARLGIIVPKVNTAQAKLIRQREQAIASGVKFTKQQRLEIDNAIKAAAAQDKLASREASLAAVRSRFGGARLTFADTAAGGFARARVALNELVEELGRGFLPPVTRAAIGAADLTQRLQQSGEAADFVRATGHALEATFEGIAAAAELVGPPLLAIAKAGEQVIQVIGGPALLTGILTYKAIGVAIEIAEAAQARWAAATATTAAAETASAGARGRAAETIGLEAAALEANTAALAANTIALRAVVGGETALGGAAARNIEILGAYGGVLATVTVETEALAVANAEAAATSGAVAGRLAGVGRGLLAFVGGPVGAVTLGVAAAAAGLVYLSRREDDLDRANARVSDSFRALAASAKVLKETTADLGAAQSQLPTDRIAATSARLAVVQAQVALSNSTAGAGSLERLQLENQLASAVDQQRIAEQRLADTRARVAADELKEIDTRRKIAQQTRNQANALGDLARQQALAEQNKISSDPVTEFANRVTQGRLGAVQAQILTNLGLKDEGDRAEDAARAADKFAEAARRRAALLGSEAPVLRRNIGLLADYAEAIKRPPSQREIKFILSLQQPDTRVFRDVERRLDSATTSVAAFRREAVETGRAITVLPGRVKGLVDPGNIDVAHRAIARLGKEVATVRAFSITTDRGETLIPSVVEGRIVSLTEAIEHFKRTGENLGTFRTTADANRYAEALRGEEQAAIAAALAQDKHATAIGQTRRTVENTAGQVRAFAAAADDEAAAQQRVHPLLASNLAQLADYARAVNRVPTSQEIDFILNVTDAKANLRSLLDAIARSGIDGAADAAKAGHALGSALIAGMLAEVRAGIPTIFSAVDALIRGTERGRREAEARAKKARQQAEKGRDFQPVGPGPIPTPAERKRQQQQFEKAQQQRRDQAKADKIIEDARRQTARDTATAEAEKAASIAESIASQRQQLADQAEQTARAIRDADQQIADAIRDGAQRVTDAVNSAKQNLNQIGQALAGDVQQFLEGKGVDTASDIRTGPLARRFRALKEELAAGTGGPEVARQAQALANQLEAQAAAAQRLGDRGKNTVQRQLADLTDLLNKRAITPQEFNRRLDQILKGAKITGARVGREFGVAARDQFLADVAGIRRQAREIARGPRRPGTGLEPTIVSPAQAQLEATKAVADAVRSRGELVHDEQKQQTRVLHEIAKNTSKLGAARTAEARARRRAQGITDARDAAAAGVR